MKLKRYRAHADRDYGNETIYDMAFDTKDKAVIHLMDILYDELGEGEGDLREHYEEILGLLSKGHEYLYADCGFRVYEEEVETGIDDCVWVLVSEDGGIIMTVDVFQSRNSLLEFMRRNMKPEQFGPYVQRRFASNGHIEIEGVTYTFYKREIRRGQVRV